MSAPPSLPVADLWLTALDKLDLDGAVVFADDRAACALSWAVGLPALLERGVHNVLRLGDRLDAPGFMVASVWRRNQ